MKDLKKQKIKQFHALLHANHMKDAKESLLAGYGVESTKDLSLKQLGELVNYLQGLQEEKNNVKEASTRKLRHKCLRIMSEIGIDTQDWNAVNQFMENKHVCGRHLYKLSDEELEAFQYKLYAIRNEINKRKKQLEQQAKLN